jgi:cyclic-di-AMP phosphodiesterase PgpH
MTVRERTVPAIVRLMRPSKHKGTWLLVAMLPVVAVVLFAESPLVWPPEDWVEFIPRQDRVADLVGLGLMLVGFALFRLRFWPWCDAREGRALRSAVLLIVVQALLLRVTKEVIIELERQGSVLWGEVWLWNPWFLTTGLAVILLGGRWGVVLSLTGAFFIQLMIAPGNLALVGSLLGSFAAVILLRRSPTRGRVLRAGSGSGAMLTGLATLDWVLDGGVVAELVPLGLVSLLVPLSLGVASAFVLLALLPLMEWGTGELSDVTLAECGSDHPLLDELRDKAPGTWHHTANVADLSRKAAAAIGARALFCYTAALFHDIGKLKDPGVFAENINGVSPHETLDPRESGRRIIQHVTDGLDLARKHRLPMPFREVIAEHHSDSLVRYFYAKAQENPQEAESPDRLAEQFRYPGPAPSTRESGIISLADMVEAATRSCGPLAQTELEAFVRKLIGQRVADGDLRDCPLSLAELDEVQRVFISWLTARNHQRPSYPSLDPAPAASGDPERAPEPA